MKIDWSDEAVAAALRVWLRLSEVGEFRDLRWRVTMREALDAAAEAQEQINDENSYREAMRILAPVDPVSGDGREDEKGRDRPSSPALGRGL